MANQTSILEASIAHAKKTLAEDPHPTQDLRPGLFFDDPNYFDTLPYDAKLLICAVQKLGEHPDRPIHCYSESQKRLQQFRNSKLDETLQQAIGLGAMALRYIPESHPARPRINQHFAELFETSWDRAQKSEDLDLCVRHYRIACGLVESTFDNLPTWLGGFALVLRKRYCQLHNSDDLEECLRVNERGIELADGNPFLAELLSNQGIFVLLSLSLISGNSSQYEAGLKKSLDYHHRAVEAYNRIIANPGNHPVQTNDKVYRQAAEAQGEFFLRTKEKSDSDKVISFYTKAQKLFDVGSADYAKYNARLGNAFAMRVELLKRNLSDDEKWKAYAASEIRNLDIRLKLVKYYEQKATAESHGKNNDLVISYLLEAGQLLAGMRGTITAAYAISEDSQIVLDICHTCAKLEYKKFQLLGQTTFIESSVEWSRLAVGLSKRPASISSPFAYEFFLAEALIDCYEVTGNLLDIESAITAALDARRNCLSTDQKVQGECLRVHARALNAKFKAVGEPDTAREAIQLLIEAQKLIPEDSVAFSLALNDLGNAYNNLHVYENARQNLDNSIESYTRALTSFGKQLARRPDASSDILMVYNGMGSAMLQRYLSFGADVDIKAAVSYFQKTLAGIDSTHPKFAFRVSNISYAVGLEYNVSKNGTLLQEVDYQIQQALDGSNNLQSSLINSLKTQRGILWFQSFKSSNVEHHLSQAIRYFSEALALDGVTAIFQATAAMDLALALSDKAKFTNEIDGFDKAVESYNKAYSLAPSGDPLRWMIRSNQAGLAFYRHKLGSKGGTEDKFGLAALDMYSQLTKDTNVPAGVRLQAASTAAALTHNCLNDTRKALEYICQSLELLPQAVLLYSSRPEQLRFIQTYHYVSSSATALTIAARESASVAIHRLESARAFLWDRLLNQISSVTELTREHPDLAETFNVLHNKMIRQSESLSVRQNALTLPREGNRLERERDTAKYEDILRVIRSKPEFSDFLRLPSQASGLQLFAVEAPIVYINISEYRSDALVITFNDTYTIPLFSSSKMEDFKAIGERMLWAKNTLKKDEEQESALKEFKNVMKWVWETIARPILDGIDFSLYKKGRTGKPRVIWVSTGWMGVLPIHAAGDFLCSDSDASQMTSRCVHDLVVSTYTPSLKALKYARDRATTQQLKRVNLGDQRQGKALLVAMTKTPGMSENSDLPHALTEVEAVKHGLENTMACELLHHPNSTAVKTQLKDANIVMFACHSQADQKDPSLSAILLQDCLAKPPRFSVRTILGSEMEDCELVYLSSCESSANKNLTLANEGINIAGGFHMVGVPHTISGMWQLEDKVSLEVAKEFFREVKNGDGSIGGERAAEALHVSVQRQRKKAVEPMLWGAFIHTGC
ncbi:hypothetical protein N431DRAFT_328263 [Stipitochalara longipes BDJ]|nr:hypothetical protein N431DRAFT_328263 [Stipitochalara longipes BDJ]